MTVEGGSGCLKELSIPAALLRREVKAICPTSKTKDTHTFKPSVSGPANRWRPSSVPNLNTEKPTDSTMAFLTMHIAHKGKNNGKYTQKRTPHLNDQQKLNPETFSAGFCENFHIYLHFLDQTQRWLKDKKNVKLEMWGWPYSTFLLSSINSMKKKPKTKISQQLL